MATSPHPPSSNPFRDPNRTPGVTPQPTGASLNPFLSPNERISPQATGASSQYLTPEQTGSIASQYTGTGAFVTPQATGAFISSQATGAFTPQATGTFPSRSESSGALNSQNTGASQSLSSGASVTDGLAALAISEPQQTYASPPGPPPSHLSSPNPSTSTPRPRTPPRSIFAPPPGPPPQRESQYAPPPGPPPNRPTSAPPPGRAPSPTPTLDVEPPPPYTPAADVRHGEIPLETGPRRAYAPEWHPDGRTWRNEAALGGSSPGEDEGRGASSVPSRDHYNQPSSSSSRPSANRPSAGASSWSAYPGMGGSGSGSASTLRPPPRHPSGSQAGSSLGRSNTTISRPTPGPPTTVPTPGRALLNQGRVLAYPAGYECNKCHLTGYQAYDPSNPCQQCWSLFAQPYEGILTFAPWDQPESVTSDEQNLQRPLPASFPRPQPRVQTSSSSRPISHPAAHSSYGPGSPGSLPPANWSSSGSSLRPSATISYSRRPPPGSLVVRPGDPRIGGRVCWKCSGDGWQYKTMGLETKTCSACNGLGRLF